MAQSYLYKKGEPKIYTCTALKEYMDEVYPLPTNFINMALDYLSGKLDEKAQKAFCKIIAKEAGERFAGYVGIALTLVEITDMLERAIHWEEMNEYFKEMSNTDSLKIRADIYMWEAGSGNSSAYYTKYDYEIV